MIAPIEAGAIHALIAENETVARHLRTKAIPHQVGMAAACRVLAVEISRTFAQQLESDLASGALTKRCAALAAAGEAVADEAAGAGDTATGLDVATDTVALLLREQIRAWVRSVGQRGRVWTAEAYRLEGQAEALEAQIDHLRRLVPPSSTASAAHDGASAEGGPTADATGHRAQSGLEG